MLATDQMRQISLLFRFPKWPLCYIHPVTQSIPSFAITNYRSRKVIWNNIRTYVLDNHGHIRTVFQKIKFLTVIEYAKIAEYVARTTLHDSIKNKKKTWVLRHSYYIFPPQKFKKQFFHIRKLNSY